MWALWILGVDTIPFVCRRRRRRLLAQAYTEDLLGRLQTLPWVLEAGIDAGSLNTMVHVGNGNEIGAVIRAVSPWYLCAGGTRCSIDPIAA